MAPSPARIPRRKSLRYADRKRPGALIKAKGATVDNHGVVVQGLREAVRRGFFEAEADVNVGDSIFSKRSPHDG